MKRARITNIKKSDIKEGMGFVFRGHNDAKINKVLFVRHDQESKAIYFVTTVEASFPNADEVWEEMELDQFNWKVSLNFQASEHSLKALNKIIGKVTYVN